MDRCTLHRRLALASRERALGSIADMPGFSSLSVFSRWFHGRFGISPTAWRNRNPS
jgi:AraC-like DNA-binding protein